MLNQKIYILKLNFSFLALAIGFFTNQGCATNNLLKSTGIFRSGNGESMRNSALIIVDLQNDFCPKGSLAVKDGDKIIPTVNALIKRYKSLGNPIYATRDWHPSNHMSFKSSGGPWPVHCVQNTPGAAFHPDLIIDDAIVINKGSLVDEEAYSGFNGTNLAQKLKERGVTDLTICGLATDYCVKATVLDGINSGFTVTVIKDGIRGVNVKPEDSKKALEAMMSAGAVIK